MRETARGEGPDGLGLSLNPKNREANKGQKPVLTSACPLPPHVGGGILSQCDNPAACTLRTHAVPQR
jgi:hypothetical protein